MHPLHALFVVYVALGGALGAWITLFAHELIHGGDYPLASRDYRERGWVKLFAHQLSNLATALAYLSIGALLALYILVLMAQHGDEAVLINIEVGIRNRLARWERELQEARIRT